MRIATAEHDRTPTDDIDADDIDANEIDAYEIDADERPSDAPPAVEPERPADAPLVLARHGCSIVSAFQPIYSFSHRRLVGHEALVRARDAAGRALPPPALFERCPDLPSLRRLDAECSDLHARGFARAARDREWLFLNVDASAFDPAAAGVDPDTGLAGIVRDAGLPPEQVVIELLEAALPDGSDFEHWTRRLKRHGFLIALDDFGAGHSNFDRVFRLRPHIVKLDRSVIARAGRQANVRRAMAQMISLLHQCEALVLVEGVETGKEATIALDSDADFVQGYHFGRPAAALRCDAEPNGPMLEVWARCDERSRVAMASYRRRIRPYGEALVAAREQLQAGLGMAEACAGFLQLERADLCFLLDEDGAQIGANVLHKTPPPATRLPHPFAPLLDVGSARWSRRPYFRRAMATMGLLQVTRPYPTMHSRRMSVTFSVAFELEGRRVVLCGDMLWDNGIERPGFGETVADAVL